MVRKRTCLEIGGEGAGGVNAFNDLMAIDNSPLVRGPLLLHKRAENEKSKGILVPIYRLGDGRGDTHTHAHQTWPFMCSELVHLE